MLERSLSGNSNVQERIKLNISSEPESLVGLDRHRELSKNTALERSAVATTRRKQRLNALNIYNGDGVKAPDALHTRTAGGWSVGRTGRINEIAKIKCYGKDNRPNAPTALVARVRRPSASSALSPERNMTKMRKSDKRVVQSRLRLTVEKHV
ncbi:hypothetical protein EVAR_46867_1 [Eumeta japonica]|uniref:Uncharacterized protein n=1 Tax=Eumeta variegata TaxID=151549 RepID=A0A4C1XPU3_EUMVA|nr:hypothetical protein EVAR_46867_1 [Eumeta japonica]